jgi:hypothetical protein
VTTAWGKVQLTNQYTHTWLHMCTSHVAVTHMSLTYHRCQSMGDVNNPVLPFSPHKVPLEAPKGWVISAVHKCTCVAMCVMSCESYQPASNCTFCSGAKQRRRRSSGQAWAGS